MAADDRIRDRTEIIFARGRLASTEDEEQALQKETKIFLLRRRRSFSLL